MALIDFVRLNKEKSDIKSDFQSKQPFRFTVFEDFFLSESAEEIFDNYPVIEKGQWNGTTYLDQKNKFQLSKFEPGSILDQVFEEMNGAEFLSWLQDVSEIEAPLLGDPELLEGAYTNPSKGPFSMYT